MNARNRNPVAAPPAPGARGWRVLRAALAAGLAVGIAAAQDGADPHGPAPTGFAKARAAHAANLAAHRDDPDRLVLPGLVADRKARTVEVLAESTGLKAGETIEFLLIDSGSGHGYEALLWSFAKPSDIHRALEFIGLKAGAPVNPAAMRFWARGDSVVVTVRAEGGEAVRIDELILDRRRDETLPEDGFVFAGSPRVPALDGEGDVYAADEYDPRSIISIYNEPTAVLDVPRQVSQGEAYGHQVVNPERAIPGGTLLKVVFAPGPAKAATPLRDLTLTVRRAEGPEGILLRLTDSTPTALAESSAPAEVLRRLLMFS